MSDAHQVREIVERIIPILAGWPSAIQGAALADCLAIWLAGHHIEGDPDETQKLRAELLSAHLILVRALATVNDKIMSIAP
jgi:hypothetical protein